MQTKLLNIMKEQQDIIETLMAQETTNTIQQGDNLILNRDQQLKLLCCLGSCTYKIDDEFITKENHTKLIDYSEEVSWLVADNLNIPLEDTYIDVFTLEVKEY